MLARPRSSCSPSRRARAACSPARAPAGAAPPDACAAALAYERTASADGVSRQAAYDAAVAGLTVNETCAKPQQRLVNEAYLLSMRAAAAHDLNVGDWRRDLARADALFTQCTTTRGLANTQAAKDCRTQLTYNRRYEAAASASPSPRPRRPRRRRGAVTQTTPLRERYRPTE